MRKILFWLLIGLAATCALALWAVLGYYGMTDADLPPAPSTEVDRIWFILVSGLVFGMLAYIVRGPEGLEGKWLG